MTIVETMISMSILVVVLGSVLNATQKGQGAYEQQMADNAIQSKAGRGLNRVLLEMSGCRAASLNPNNPLPPVGSDFIEFQRSEGYVAGAVQWGPVIRIGFELEDSEMDNGIDDDRDGLVDEGVVVRIENPRQIDEERRVLFRGVRRFLQGEAGNGGDDNGNGLADEAGLCFERDGNVLIVRLSLEGVGPSERLVTKTVESSIQIRN